MAQGRHIRRRRLGALAIVAIVAGALLLVAGGVAFAAYRYERANQDRILPGVRVAGVDVSGMTRDEAIQAVTKVAERRWLSRSLAVSVGGERWGTIKPASLGQSPRVAMAVDRALAAGDDLGTVSRFWHRFRDEPVQVGIRLRFRLGGNSIDGLVGSIADDVRVEPRDAAIGISDDHTDIALVHAKAGTKLAERSAAAAITSALRHHATAVDLKTAAITPKVTAKNLGPTIVVRVNENRLSLYDGFDVEQTWSVATAKPGYTTPTGVWNIYDKRENPTWYNPALDGWGADLPAVIPGGPGNPMGTRAIYIDAPGLIRIHGTTDDGSIGRYASHGCIRMHNSEVEDLFDRIPVGAHVVVVGFRPAEAGYWSVPPASDI